MSVIALCDCFQLLKQFWEPIGAHSILQKCPQKHVGGTPQDRQGYEQKRKGHTAGRSPAL
jgi:hypothetical protein